MWARSWTYGTFAGVIVSLAFAIALAGVPRTAVADATHYQTLQLGERSRGMAAAYTAFAADGAAIWYNPAGLPLLEAKLLQGSLSLFQIRTVDLEDAVVSDGRDGPGGVTEVNDFKLQSSPTLPGFAVASFALGKRREEFGNRKAIQIAISAFQTYNEEVSGDVQIRDEYGRTNSIQFLQIDRQTYVGAALGYRITRNFLAGISLFASNRVVNHVETIAVAFDGTQDPSQGSPCPSSPTVPFCINNADQTNRNTVFNMNAWYLLARIGLMQLIGERWRVGLMFQTPGVRVGGQSTLRFELSDVEATMNPAPSESVYASITRSSNSPIPWTLRLGAAYVISKKVIVDADLQLVGPVKSGQITPDLPQLEGRANTSGALLSTGTRRDFTWNVSIGTEIQITRFLFTRFGFLTDRSSAPSVAPDSTQVQGLDVDRIGFSASIGGQKNARGLSAGVTALFGRGTGVGLDLRQEAFENNETFRRVDAKERIFIISIGGDVGQTADIMKNQIKEKRKSKEPDQARRRQRAQEEIDEELDPELKAARQKAEEALKAAEDARRDLEALEEEKRQLENLSDEDQGALQGATQKGINVAR